MEARQSLEDIMQTPLAPNERVMIMAYTPAEPPTEEARRAARETIRSIQAQVAAYQQTHGITAEEVDTAVDEAFETIRRARRA